MELAQEKVLLIGLPPSPSNTKELPYHFATVGNHQESLHLVHACDKQFSVDHAPKGGFHYAQDLTANLLTVSSV